MIPLTVPEVRRLLQLLLLSAAHQAFHLEWSYWRRRHQAVARRGHIIRRARERAAALPVSRVLATPPPVPPPPAWATLSDTQWARVQPLLGPPAPVGRRGRPARQVLAAILWLHRTNATWHTLPAEFGPWHTIYNRYRVWRQSGLWPRLLHAIESADPEVSL